MFLTHEVSNPPLYPLLTKEVAMGVQIRITTVAQDANLSPVGEDVVGQLLSFLA